MLQFRKFIISAILMLTLGACAPEFNREQYWLSQHLDFTKSSFLVAQSLVPLGKSILLSVTLKTQDGNDSTLRAETVNFSVSGGTSTGTLSAVTNVGDGTYTATYTGTGIGTASTVSATVNGINFPGSLQTVQVVPNYNLIKLTGNSAPATNACTAISVSTFDSGGTPFPMVSPTLISFQASGAFNYFSDAGCSSAITSLTLLQDNHRQRSGFPIHAAKPSIWSRALQD